MNMIRLIYVSELAQGISLSDIQNIWSLSIKSNKKNLVHGLLLFKNTYFLQVLEGGAEVVNDTFSKIKMDKRHHHVKLLGIKAIDNYSFERWSMGYIITNEQVKQIIDKFAPPPKSLKNLSFKNAYNMLKELANLKGAIQDIEITLGQITTS